MTPRVLFPYQQEAVDAVLHNWGSDIRRTAVALPTGTGKSTVIASVAAAAANLGLRVVMVAHRAELLDQMAKTVAVVDPTLEPVGIVRAEHDEPDAQIVAASLQTLTNRRRHEALGKRDVVLWDEVHHGGAVSWRQVLDDFGTPFFCGFSATLRRDDGKALREIIDTVAYERDLRWAISEGHLVRPSGLTVMIPDLDLGKVKTVAGDFAQGELAEIMEAETEEVVNAIVRHAADRRPIIFAASVQAAGDIAQLLTQYGMKAEAVTGAMQYWERQLIYADFRSGTTRALVTVQVLTEGADFPMCDAAVIARPTRSQNLYSQMVGRALRLYPGKTDALVLDLVGTSRVLKLVTLANLDAGTTSKKVDTEGHEVEPDPDEVAPEPIAPRAAPAKRLGPIDTIGIDLLGPEETGVLWLGTPKGVPFLAPQDMDAAVFLWQSGFDESGTTYKVGTMSIKGAKSGGWVDDGREWPLHIAMGIAEDYIVEEGYSYPLRGASWRKSAPASAAQLRFAESLGIDDAHLMSKARLSDEITIKLVAARLDTAR